MHTDTNTEICTVEQLEDVVGFPVPAAANKVRERLSPIHREWIASSPFCLLATSDAEGSCDVSPKGDPPGFVHVIDDHTVAIPERPGNRRVDGWRNVLSNPHVGLLFLTPGRTDTLRINGRARLVTGAPYFEEMAIKGRSPILACEVTVDEVFLHCPKAFLRSGLWNHEQWPEDTLPSVAQIAKMLTRPETPLAELEKYYGPSYAEHLY